MVTMALSPTELRPSPPYQPSRPKRIALTAAGPLRLCRARASRVGTRRKPRGHAAFEDRTFDLLFSP